jgi:hypothetical protein
MPLGCIDEWDQSPLCADPFCLSLIKAEQGLQYRNQGVLLALQKTLKGNRIADHANIRLA